MEDLYNNNTLVSDDEIDDINNEEIIEENISFNDDLDVDDNIIESNDVDNNHENFQIEGEQIDDVVSDDDSTSGIPALERVDESEVDDDSDGGSVHSSEFSFNIPERNDDSILSENIEDGDVDDVYDNDSIHEGVDGEYPVEDEPDNEIEEVERSTAQSINARPRRANAGAGIERLEVGFGGKEYASVQHKQFVIKRAMNVLLTQMSANEGIRRFGEKAIAAMIKELKQLNDGAVEGKPVVGAVDPDSLTSQEKFEALEAINLIKEKRDGRIKGRTCANGKKQIRFVKEGDIFSSPTVSLESIMTTLVIDTYEGRIVSIVDVPGSYLHAKMPEEKRLLLKLRGQFVDIMCNVNPEYRSYVRVEKGVKVLYLPLLRALYGCLESALLWYELYSSTLVSMGFKLNPYDMCVANKIIDGSQCMITFYVDDNKIIHKRPEVVKRVISELEQHFGKLTVKSDVKHFNFLGMDVHIKKKIKKLKYL